MLPRIPVVTGTTRDLLAAHLPAARALVAEARRIYSALGVRAADAVSRGWLGRTGNPYLAELDAMADVLGEPGLHMLNVSYEWGCTAGTGGGRLLRTLDWPFHGLGRHVAVLDTEGRAGRYLSVTWPGFAGVLTALAPGRFAASINQAKAFHGRLTGALEWPLNRARFLGSRALPPAHLLRGVCDTAPDYDEAVRLLAAIPVALPVFFILAAADGRGCVIEREPCRAHIHPAPAACANHWYYPGLQGPAPRLACRIDAATPFTRQSRARQAAMLSSLEPTAGAFDWLRPPVLCPDTRIACVMDVAQGRLAVIGVDAMAPATEILDVAA